MRVDLLHIAVAEACGARFKWGEHDCAHFAMRVLQAAHGLDFDVPEYGSEAEALTLIEGYGSLEAAASAVVGSMPQSPSEVRLGDLVLMDSENSKSLGVCLGGYSAFPGIPSGVVLRANDQLECCWSVG